MTSAAPGPVLEVDQLGMRFGGLIVFDTRDDERAVAGTETPEREALQAILRRLDIPPLTPLPPDHVLLRSFYLLPDLPGWSRGTCGFRPAKAPTIP